MNEEDLLSVSLIPDTPSPVFGRSKSRRVHSSSEELAVTNYKVPDHVVTSSSSVSSKQNSPDSTDNRCNYSFAVPNGLSLPGSPKFALERQEMVRKKSGHKYKSPFLKSKYTLSPIKNGYTSCKFDNMPPCSSTPQFPLSTLDENEASSSSCMQPQPKFSGFVKSSSLLQESFKAAKLKHISKRTKVETASFNDAIEGRKKKIPQKATFAWPSSSSDSSDEEFVLSGRGKKELKTKSSTKTSTSGNGRPGPIQYTDFNADKCSVGDSAHSEWEKNPCLFADSTSAAKQKSRKRKVETTSLYGADQRFGSSAYLDCDSSNSSLFNHTKSSEGDSTICKKDEKAKKSKTCVNNGMIKTKNTNKQASSQRTDEDLSLGFTLPDLSPYRQKPKSGAQSHLFHHQNLDSSFSQPPQLSPIDMDIDRCSSTSGSAQQPHSGAFLYPFFTSDSINSTPAGSNTVGTPGNPIDLTSMTPETQRAMKEIKQLQSDEDLARKLQEDLDREYAMSLQSDHHHATSQPQMNMPQPFQSVLGNVDSGAPHHGEFSATSPHWHMYSPVRQRPTRRRGASRQGGNSADPADSPTDQLRRLLQMYSNLGTNAGPDVHQNHMWDRAPSRHGRRHGGRRGRGELFGMYSPGGNGEDYENLMNLAEILGEVKEKGLSKSELARLPIVSYTKTEGQEVEECNICMTDYENGDSQKILPCFHSFHSKCIDKWIEKNATCPICRVEVKVS